ncbi:MAG: hypothetical protein EA417_14400 [Gammaproteobacteria bacterium]|nr:MAG: hypothetical protein EA417_14400 [Gammaproteobacteria bacterium]
MPELSRLYAVDCRSPAKEHLGQTGSCRIHIAEEPFILARASGHRADFNAIATANLRKHQRQLRRRHALTGAGWEYNETCRIFP